MVIFYRFLYVCHGGTWYRRSDGSCVCRVTQRGLLHWAATAAAIEEAVKHSRLQPAEGRRKGAQGGVVRMFIVYIYNIDIMAIILLYIL